MGYYQPAMEPSSSHFKFPLVMGVVNVTPDSFSDGGLYNTPEKAFEHAVKLVEEGADILDFGGESSRPGSLPVDVETEKARVLPVIGLIRQRFPKLPLSIDTYKFEVAEAAVEKGATLINDISAASDIRMAKLAKQKNLTLILMHMKGTPKDMQAAPHYPNGVLADATSFLKSRVRQCVELGMSKQNLWIDPGIGFGKSLEHNLDLLRRLDKLRDLGPRLVVGTSRKSFIARLTGNAELPIEERLPGTLSSHLYAYHLGASVFRVHEVKEMKRALQMWDAIRFGL